jgi:hypothetical protein
MLDDMIDMYLADYRTAEEASMTITTVNVRDLERLEHDEAMDLADAEFALLLAEIDLLRETDWARSTDCAGWDVQAMLGHLLGMLELQADPADRMRQITTAAQEPARTGGLRLDAMTAPQVREHAPSPLH